MNIPAHMLESFNMPNTWAMPKLRQGHNSLSDVELTQRNHPLACTNQRLVLRCIIWSAQRGIVKFRVVIMFQR